jgi:hypothetical protein
VIETPAEILAHHATTEAAASFVAWRKKAKRPLTETAALRIAKTLAAIVAAGGDASDALGMAEERGWQTIRPDWYFKAMKEEAAAMPKPSPPSDKLTTWADNIRTGREYMCRSIPATAARELVHRGMVTLDQCKRAGVSI